MRVVMPPPKAKKSSKPSSWKRGTRRSGSRGGIETFDIITGEYASFMKGAASKPTEKDEIITAILQQDRMQKEYLKRLILDDSRLDILMKLLGLYVRPHHNAFIQYFDRLRARGIKSGMLLAPRGSGKSTSNDICYATMRAIQNRDVNILIASRTSDQAKSFLSAIKGNLQKPQITELFGELVGEKWDETAASIAGRQGGVKEHTFHIAGADGSVVSKHFDIIIADDLVEEKNSKTEEQRKNVEKFFYKSLLPCLRADGEIWVLGTRYHPEDLYNRFTTVDPMFKNSYCVFPGVFDRQTGEPVSLLQKPDGTFALPPNAEVWDPIGFPVEKVLMRREGMPQGDFEAQYQNQIEMLCGDYFNAEWFKYYSEDPHYLIQSLGLRVWMAADLAASKKASADEFAICVVGIHPKSFEIYVLDTVSGRFSFNHQKALLVDMFDKWDPIRTFVESNAYQGVLESTAREEFPDIRTQPIYTVQDKITRASAFQLYYERGQVFHRKNRSAKLEGQLTGFPHLKLKDLFDALYIAVWGAMRGGRRSRRREEPGVIGG